MALLTPLWMQAAPGDTAPQYSASLDRQLLMATVVNEGVTRLTGLRVTQRGAGANMSVDVASGQILIIGDDVAGQGRYLCTSTATENLPIPAPPGVGSRTHRVIARVRDYLHNGALSPGTYDWVLEVLEDTGSGTPATPASALSLATVTVSAGQTSVLDSHITDTRVVAQGLPGRPFQVGSDADRPPNPYTAEEWWRTDRLYHEYYDGTGVGILYNNRSGPQWGTYTPTLTATTTNPNLGSGTTLARTGYYTRVGRTIHATVYVRAGDTGVSPGTGNYRISLPVAARTISPAFYFGVGSAFDASANDAFDAVVRVGPTTNWNTAEIFVDSTTWSSAGPFVLAAGDSIGFSITYEAAS